ncbi:MAG: hypothetical protein ACFHWX_07240 [Bacteroidota bacterium]
MKKKYYIPILVIAIFYAILYFWRKEEVSTGQHPTLHSTATRPDDYLLDAKDYEDMKRHDKSAYSIEKAIESIWRLEKDVDDESFDRLEETISRLEAVHRRIIRDTVPSHDLLVAFEYALGNLAHAELEVAEKYSASNQIHEALSALKYAQLHIKNALIFHNPNVEEDSVQLASEAMLFDKMDSLFRQKDLTHEEYTAMFDTLIKEVDRIISKIETD